MTVDLQEFADEEFCYLQTTGRVTGKAHEIEIWFALDGTTLYMMAGNHGSDWVRNIQRTPAVTVRIRDQVFRGIARMVALGSPEDEHARLLVGPKYGEWQAGQPRAGWTWTALPVAIEIDSAAG